jgi:hypothetical protein
MQVGLDVYNVMNTDVATTYNPAYSPTGVWPTPATIQPARYGKINVQVDF